MKNTDTIDYISQLDMSEIEILTSSDPELQEAFENLSLNEDDAIEQLKDLLGDSVAF